MRTSTRTTTIPNRLTAALALLALAAVPAVAEGASRSWQGRYRYEHVAGRTAGGTGIVVTYDLALGPPGARGGCLLTMTGFQTDERLLCQTSAGGGDLTVGFHRYPDGRTLNRYGVAVYKPGQPLFTLSKGADGTIVTRWQGLKPDGEGVAESGSYFAQAKAPPGR